MDPRTIAILKAHSLIDSQIADFNPKLRIKGALLKDGKGWLNSGKYFQDATGLITEFFRIATFDTIEELAGFFKLPAIHKICMPQIVFSDIGMDQTEYRNGMDLGFYELRSCCFLPNGRQSRDSRPNFKGPVIFYLGKPSLETIQEESIHFLQWAHEMGPEKLKKIDKERQVPLAEINPDRYKVKQLDNGILVVKGIKPSVLSAQFLSKKSDSLTEILAQKVLYESCAEYYRCHQNQSNQSVDFHFLDSWSKKTFTFELGTDNQYNNLASLYSCFTSQGIVAAFEMLAKINNCQSIEQFIEKYAHNSISLYAQMTDPQGLIYFFGHALARDLSAKAQDQQDFYKIIKCFFPGHKNPSSGITRVDVLTDYAAN